MNFIEILQVINQTCSQCNGTKDLKPSLHQFNTKEIILITCMQLTFILLLGSLVWALLPTVISACRPVNELPSLAGATVTADVMLAISPFFIFPSLDHLTIIRIICRCLRLWNQDTIPIYNQSFDKCLVDFDPRVETWG